MSFSVRFFVALPGQGRAAAVRVLPAVLIAVLALTAQPPAAAMAQGQTKSALNAGSPSGQLGLLDVVVLVDESGSENTTTIGVESATTLEIAESMLSQQSRITVVGFGGVNNVTPGQVATDSICKPTIASPPNYGYLTSCVNSLHQRKEKEGDDTDYAAALGQAMTYLNPSTAYGRQSPAGAKKVILMMTDGAVDVHRNTQEYGQDWQQGEQTAISDQLSTAMQDGVQFWGLGFGADIGTPVDGNIVTKAAALTYLNNMAAEGAPAVCDGRKASVQPNARWVDNPDDVFLALGQLSADASCSAIITRSTTANGTVPVTIPDYASSGVITVDRGNPSVQVTFVQPNGQPWTDSSAISGQDSAAVESLHLPNLTSDEVGRPWTVKLSAPQKFDNQLVHVSAFWQGAVRALITANPSSARPGQTVCSELSLEGPRGPLAGTADISGLQVGVMVVGDGLSQPVPVTSAGTPSCPTSGPGTYSGTMAAPASNGSLTFTGIAAGYGITTTYVPTTVSVAPVVKPFTAVIQYPADQARLRAQAGSGLPLTAVFTNDTGSAQRARLTVSGAGASPSIGGTSSEFTVGAAKSVPFTVDFPSNSPPGLTGVHVTVTNATTGQALATAAFDVTVTKPPGFWARYQWWVIGAVIALLLLLLSWRWRRAVRQWRMDVRGLVASLRREGFPPVELSAPSRQGDSFNLYVVDPEDRSPRLGYQGPGLAYMVQRSGNREVKVIPPAGAPREVVLGEGTVQVEGTPLLLAFDEDRRRSRPWWVFRADRGPRRRPAKGGPGRQWQPTVPEQQAPPELSAIPEPANPASPVGEQPDNSSELW